MFITHSHTHLREYTHRHPYAHSGYQTCLVLGFLLLEAHIPSKGAMRRGNHFLYSSALPVEELGTVEAAWCQALRTHTFYKSYAYCDCGPPCRYPTGV